MRLRPSGRTCDALPRQPSADARQLHSAGMTRISDRTVLFADLRGSTALFETLGNAEATSVVTHCVDALARAGRRAAAATSSRRWATA
ncbi:MAG: hypothetical protein MZW92_69985 [Comamonadaceae bacterium]|nr:hypothetical protein [Comamonadaceae bacterium]